MNKKITTLLMIHDDQKILLGLKKRGFAEGRWNGFGGKVNPGEDIGSAAMREVGEEIGVKPLDMKKRGVFTFEFEGNPELLEMHLFSATKFEGEPSEGEEMKPRWYKFDEIPFDKMWPDDRYWFPLLFAGKNFNAYFKFRGHDEILEHKIEEV